MRFHCSARIATSSPKHKYILPSLSSCLLHALSMCHFFQGPGLGFYGPMVIGTTLCKQHNGNDSMQETSNWYVFMPFRAWVGLMFCMLLFIGILPVTGNWKLIKKSELFSLWHYVIQFPSGILLVSVWHFFLGWRYSGGWVPETPCVLPWNSHSLLEETAGPEFLERSNVTRNCNIKTAV